MTDEQATNPELPDGCADAATLPGHDPAEAAYVRWHALQDAIAKTAEAKARELPAGADHASADIVSEALGDMEAEAAAVMAATAPTSPRGARLYLAWAAWTVRAGYADEGSHGFFEVLERVGEFLGADAPRLVDSRTLTIFHH